MGVPGDVITLDMPVPSLGICPGAESVTEFPEFPFKAIPAKGGNVEKNVGGVGRDVLDSNVRDSWQKRTTEVWKKDGEG